MTRLARALGILSLLVLLAVGAQPAFADEAASGATPAAGLNALIGTGSGASWDHVHRDCDSDTHGGFSGMHCHTGLSSSWSGMSPWGGLSAWGGLGGWGGWSRPWWAGMPLGVISASSGGTWPWAPWYYTPMWWYQAALMNSR
jgi:hypothetical protein